MPSWLSPTWFSGRMLSMALPMGSLQGFPSQLSLQTRTGHFKSTCRISAPTLRFLLHSQKRAFSSRCATLKPGTTSHLIWNLKSGRLKQHELRIRSQYPDDLIFTAEPFAQRSAFKGKVFRSDSGEAISNSYIRLTSEEDQAKHFDTRTDEKGEYRFGGIPAGNYKVSIYAWFPKRSEVPCRNPVEQKTVDGGDITVEWQWRSQAFS